MELALFIWNNVPKTARTTNQHCSGPLLSNSFAPYFPLFFQEKQGKLEKQETFAILVFGNLTAGKIWKNKLEKKFLEKNLEIWTKMSSDK